MDQLTWPSLHAFRDKRDNRGGGEDRPTEKVDLSIEPRSDDDGRWLVCKQCSQKITKPVARIAVNGSHRHTFANPSGIVFEIGCFNHVRGCSGYGQPSNDFTWFSGFAWQVTICGKCLTHIGWRFTSSSSEPFIGLILDRLVEVSDSDS